ncbi:MAG: hypothetical protein PHH19_02835 [Eubacteriales bacterium]|nr:hypothetical protein [Eubacteriales bacterium]
MKELENKIDKLEVKFELLEKYIELNELDSIIIELDLSSKEINKAVEIINKYSHTEILKDWDKNGLTKYTVKKELEKVSPVFIDTENVEDFISALATELDDENYKMLAERLTWKIMSNDLFDDLNNL